MGARDVLNALADAGLSVQADGDRLVIRPASRLTDALRANVRSAKPGLLALLTAGSPPAGPYRLTPAAADLAHAQPWSEADCQRFTVRVVHLVRRGFDASDADDLAEALHLRDVQGDELRLCAECAHLRGNPGPWRCGQPHVSGMGHALAAQVVTLPQRCPGFTLAPGLS